MLFVISQTCPKTDLYSVIPGTRVMCSLTESTDRKNRKEWGKGRKEQKRTVTWKRKAKVEQKSKKKDENNVHSK
jgi:hypothetical protein